ncbi:MAG TPA: hypothetical protein VFT75_16245 [Nocardioidaceae bacterium]|jgi:hypothetical protein|nr:hypothetical protein [Nocardioidaceae bacterium]
MRDLLRPSPVALAYVAVVTVLAAAGFVLGKAWLVLTAVVLALPAAVVALPGYYLGYGLLALVPGANPDHSTGSGIATPDGHVVSVVTSGDPATWFTVVSHALGIAALLAAALANVLLVRWLAARRATVGANPH